VRTVYLAHPLSDRTPEGVARNRFNAAHWGIWIAKVFPCSVSADWIWWSMVLDESSENRVLGLERDCVQIGKCDELWMTGGRCSSGMAIESAHAKKTGVVVRDLTGFGYLPPQSWPTATRELTSFVELVFREWS